MNIIWRVAGIAVLVGLALFLLSLMVKFLLAGLGLFLLVRVVGPRLIGPRMANRAFGQMERGDWQQSDITSIDDPAWRAGKHSSSFGRVIAIQ